MKIHAKDVKMGVVVGVILAMACSGVFVLIMSLGTVIAKPTVTPIGLMHGGYPEEFSGLEECKWFPAEAEDLIDLEDGSINGCPDDLRRCWVKSAASFQCCKHMCRQLTVPVRPEEWTKKAKNNQYARNQWDQYRLTTGTTNMVFTTDTALGSGITVRDGSGIDSSIITVE